jgi:4-hydroxy-4-methyl-2-oxoglutarate aldolase
MKKLFVLLIAVTFLGLQQVSAQIALSKEMMLFYTSEWKGPRFDDGRPKVSDDLMKRLKNISIEEAWGIMRNDGYNNQFVSGWKMLHDDQPFVGRALTAVYYPKRPDVNKMILDKGHGEGRIGNDNSWPIDMLKEGDVYVADCFGKVVDGTLIGDNLGNSIYAKSKTGVVFDGGARDLQGLEEIDGFNAVVRDWDPSFLRETMLMGINVPIRIGNAIVFPGDLVLAKKEGVIFVPPQLAEKVVITAEFIALRDQFGHQMLINGTYTPGQIDAAWTDSIKKAFLKWLDDNPNTLPMKRADLDAYMKDRNW